MKALLLSSYFLVVASRAATGTDDIVDRIDDALTWSTANDRIRARLSGTLELEEYWLPQPSQGVIYADEKRVAAPRLVLFLDAQAGDQGYFFTQARVDRGFDPGEAHTQLRLDEYALRFTPKADARLNFQIGKFATVVGNWTSRHLAWDNPFITAPLPYENLTGIWDQVAAPSVETLRRWAYLAPGPARGNPAIDQSRVPIIWGPSYALGAAVSGIIAKFNYAVEIKNASLSSRPARWNDLASLRETPTYSGRIGYRPDERWIVGASFSTGPNLRSAARPTLASGTKLKDYREIVFGQDLSFAWHHWQIWAEAYETRFTIPRVGKAETLAYYLELKYKFTPQFFAALRWNQQIYGQLATSTGTSLPWGRDVWRVDFAPSYRFNPHSELKLQYSLQAGGAGPHNYFETIAVQFVLRF